MFNHVRLGVGPIACRITLATIPDAGEQGRGAVVEPPGNELSGLRHFSPGVGEFWRDSRALSRPAPKGASDGQRIGSRIEGRRSYWSA